MLLSVPGSHLAHRFGLLQRSKLHRERCCAHCCRDLPPGCLCALGGMSIRWLGRPGGNQMLLRFALKVRHNLEQAAQLVLPQEQALLRRPYCKRSGGRRAPTCRMGDRSRSVDRCIRGLRPHLGADARQLAEAGHDVRIWRSPQSQQPLRTTARLPPQVCHRPCDELGPAPTPSLKVTLWGPGGKKELDAEGTPEGDGGSEKIRSCRRGTACRGNRPHGTTERADTP